MSEGELNMTINNDNKHYGTNFSVNSFMLECSIKKKLLE